MFVDVRPYLKSVTSKETTLSLKWSFDKFTSIGLIMDYDENSNSKLDSSEAIKMSSDFKNQLKKNKFFMKIQLNGKPPKYKLSAFKIKTDKKVDSIAIIYFEFDVTLVDDMKKQNQLSISFYDHTIYSVLTGKDKFTVNKNIKVISNIADNKKCLFKVDFRL